MIHNATISNTYGAAVRRPVLAVYTVLLGVLFIVTAMLYIRFVNNAVIGSLSMQRMGHAVIAAQEEVRELEAQVARLAVGNKLQKRAQELGLENAGPGQFVKRDTYVAKAN